MMGYVFGAIAASIPLLFILGLYVNRAAESDWEAYELWIAQQEYQQQEAARVAFEAEQFAQEYGRMQLQAELNAQALARYAREHRS